MRRLAVSRTKKQYGFTSLLCLLLLSSTPAKGGAYDSAKLWLPGSTLKVCFFSGTDEFRNLVALAPREWSGFGNIKFDFGESPKYRNCTSAEPSDIRISISNGPSWSFIGTDAKINAALTEPTMSLSDDAAKGTVLHEFGHALGFIHENQSPNAPCYWELDKDKLQKILSGFAPAENFIYANFAPIHSPTVVAGAFDPRSIMMLLPSVYKIDSVCALPAVATRLSPEDAASVAKAYPGTSGPVAEAQSRPSPLSEDRRGHLALALEEAIHLSRELLKVPVWNSFGPAASMQPLETKPLEAKTIVALSRRAVASIASMPEEQIKLAVAAQKQGRYDEVHNLIDRYLNVPPGAPDTQLAVAALLIRANMALEGNEDPPSLGSALPWIRGAAERESKAATTLLGLYDEFGLRTGTPDLQRAKASYEEAAHEEPTGAHRLGLLYYTGTGVPRDYTKAVATWARRSNTPGPVRSKMTQPPS
jgi:hypothetical protein